MTEDLVRTKDIKLYSQRSIGIATFLGGPLAAGYLIGENYRNLEELDNGKRALIIGLVATVLLFVGIYSVPESIMEKVPNQIIPLAYTGLIYLIVEKIHGTTLNQHKENGSAFYSGWRAAGVGAVSMAILFVGLLAIASVPTGNELFEKYDLEMQAFSKNERESLFIYDELGKVPNHTLAERITVFALPKWTENIEIINRTNAYENLPIELQGQNEILLEYCLLRIEAFRLLKKALEEGTNKYDPELGELNTLMEKTLEKL